MSEPTPSISRRLLHRRAIDVQVFARDDGLFEVEAELTDTKTRDVIRRARDVMHTSQPILSAYDSTDDVRRQRAFAAIRESKADEETELWLRRLRDEAFVEVKM